ncbi:MAG: alpha/beta fold hydrolase [Steroidobacteraceae bacterium]
MEPQFLTVGDRQVHCWVAGDGPPIVLLHPSPLSSRVVLPVAEALARHFRVYALDTPGYGLSDAPAQRPQGLEDFLPGFADTFDALGLTRFCLYGAATGAQFAIALAKRYPQRIALAVLDAAGHFDPARTDAIIDSYFPDLTPQPDGRHLATVWQMVRDLFVFFPWCERSAAARLPRDLPPAAFMQDYLLEYLRAGAHYDWAYRPAFYHERIERAREVTVPALLVRWAASPVLQETDALIDGGLPDNYRVLRLGATPAERSEGITGAVQALYGDAPAAGTRPPATPPAGRIASSYVVVDGQRLHLRLRLQGAGRPLLVLHGAGRSAAAMERELDAAARARPVICIDLPGHGESARLPPGQPGPEVDALAQAVAGALRALGVDGACDVLAEPLGACVAHALRKRSPPSVAQLQTVGRSAPATLPLDEWLARHVPDLAPAVDGTHLLRAWHHVRDGLLWSPWWQRTRAQALAATLPGAAELHARVVDLMKAGPAYPAAIGAEYRYRAAHGELA